MNIPRAQKTTHSTPIRRSQPSALGLGSARDMDRQSWSSQDRSLAPLAILAMGLISVALVTTSPSSKAASGHAGAPGAGGPALQQSAAYPAPIAGADADARLQALVSRRLAWDRQLAPFGVEAKVEDSVVTLSGAVPSKSLRKAAGRAAEEVAGIEKIVNRLDVDQGTARVAGDEPQPPSDAAIARRVVTVLASDRDVSSGAVDVSVADGVVALTGRVPNSDQKREAERIAGSLFGVRGVINQLAAVKP